MEQEIVRNQGRLAVHLSGRITYKDHGGFAALSQQLADGVRELVVDLAGVTFIDSAGVGMLLILNDAATREGATMKVQGVIGQVCRLFKASEMARVLAWESGEEGPAGSPLPAAGVRV